MQDQDSVKATRSNGTGFIGYAIKRLILTVILTVVLIGGAAYLLNHFEIKPVPAKGTSGHEPADSGSESHSTAQELEAVLANPNDTLVEDSAIQPLAPPDMQSETNQGDAAAQDSPYLSAPARDTDQAHVTEMDEEPTAGHHASETHAADPGTNTQIAPFSDTDTGPQSQDGSSAPVAPPDRHPTPPSVSGAPPNRPQGPEQEQVHRRAGVAFVEAIIKPMDDELNQRFLGWRPNDIFTLADNTKNYQLGVLEVTRRTIDHLAAHIASTRGTDTFNLHVENAINGFKVDADRYWFPSPESKYKEGLKELEAYKQALTEGKTILEAQTATLIPLLKEYEKLLQSCDEDLVKRTEMDGSKVSLFKADNYFYYAKGIVGTLSVILEAIQDDFAQALEKQNGSELLHHAVTSCGKAAELSPLFITNSDLDGLFANHRANMAAPLSHARAYLNQLIKALST